ncbi:hypothetical protein BROUX41_003944 [Berkeleyomyces rouxiae]|uniref:uncharacterized protein n=1 Tax=Berkeleyomyces rouxiae TaxID=2035830 RepID=UPI003B780DBD
MSSSLFRLSQAKTAHVNLMTDTIIANLPPDALRSVLRAVLTTSPEYSIAFEAQAKKYLERTCFPIPSPIFACPPAPPIGINFCSIQSRIRSTLGAGLVRDALRLLCSIIQAASNLEFAQSDEETLRSLLGLDGDVVQAITAVQKTLSTPNGTRPFSIEETKDLKQLFAALTLAKQNWAVKKEEFVLERGLVLVSKLLDTEVTDEASGASVISPASVPISGSSQSAIETFSMGDKVLPRLFSGLWQLSSPSWGVASKAKIMAQFEYYANLGFTAFDMADHYGDAEIIYADFRRSYHSPQKLYAGTKFCVFGPLDVTPKTIAASITERLIRLHSESIDLLQFHWQDYSNLQFISATKILAADTRIKSLGLCNFDTLNMLAIIDAGVTVVSNQVQFSLIDSRPTFAMAPVCIKRNIKLLTYGTLCGGFLANKWLDQPEPELFSDGLTPSQRKYCEMINIWGDWKLFQELLHVLSTIANKRQVSISNVATRWVLDFDYVGAVLVGTRMGVSEHATENLKSYGWRLDDDDRLAIEVVQRKSRHTAIFEAMGDCGSEYR